MVTYCLKDVSHSYVHRKNLDLTAGRNYVWDTRNLRKLYTWWPWTPDTYMYLVRLSDNQIVAKNDDYIGRASLISYSPSVSGVYSLIIRAYSKYSMGRCDVYQSTDGSTPTKIGGNVKFAGMPINAHWKADETIQTRNATGDTYLYLINGNTMLRDDDSGSGLCSSIRPGYEAWGLVILSSYSSYTEGRCWLCNYYKSYFDNPGDSDFVDDPTIRISEKMVKFQQDLIKMKPSWEMLPFQEREDNVKKLQNKILDKKDIEQFGVPDIEKLKVNEKYRKIESEFDELLEATEKKLKGASNKKRTMEMNRLKTEKNELFRKVVSVEDF